MAKPPVPAVPKAMVMLSNTGMPVASSSRISATVITK